MVDVPPRSPATTPVVAPTVATEVLLLAHVPPPTTLEYTTDKPSHTVLNPVMADGVRLTVTIVVELQPVGNV